MPRRSASTAPGAGAAVKAIARGLRRADRPSPDVHRRSAGDHRRRSRRRRQGRRRDPAGAGHRHADRNPARCARAAPSISPASASASSIRTGAKLPDIANAAAIRKTAARSALDRLSRSAIGRRLGGTHDRADDRRNGHYRDACRSKLTLASAIGGGVDLVAGGKAEIGLFNISEILPIQGVALVGPLPPRIAKLYRVRRGDSGRRQRRAEPARGFHQCARRCRRERRRMAQGRIGAARRDAAARALL